MNTEPDSADPGDAPDAVSHQPALPDLELPDYHGRKPVGMKTALTGAGNRLSRPHGIGDRVVLVIEAKVKRAGHEDTDDGMVYAETHKVVDLFELDRDPGARLLSHLRSTYRVARDAAEGKVPIPELGDEGWTDANGVVLTPQELAERRGDPVALLGAETLTPAVVVYEDGDRLLWPDEYPKDSPRPYAGQETDDGQVVELLHHVTGETLESVSAEPEPAADDYDPVEDLPDNDPEADADDYDYADDYADDDEQYADVVPFEKPQRDPEPPALPGEEELAARLPDAAAFAFVDTTVPNLRKKLDDVADLVLLRRYLEAEKQGRGRALLPRKGATDAILARIAAVEELA